MSKKFVNAEGITRLWAVIQYELNKKADIEDVQNYDDTAIKGRMSEAESSLNTLKGNDSNSSVREIANDVTTGAIAALVNNAPAAFDTLKELADWIANNAGENDSNMNAAQIIAKINAVESDLADKLEQSDLANYLTNNDITAADIAAWNSAATNAHTHANQQLLDTFDAATGNWHKHANQAVLDGITAEKVAAWDALEDCDCVALTIAEIDSAIRNANLPENTITDESGNPLTDEEGDPITTD